jgi:hypothetical protein
LERLALSKAKEWYGAAKEEGSSDVGVSRSNDFRS